jgi:hypothetical protein
MRRAALLSITVLAVLTAPAAAWAGGWASAQLSSTPQGVGPGEPWTVDITILQHGRTPMTDVDPAVVVALPDGGERRFGGKPVDGEPGVYRASVVFPEAGRYAYKVDDGFTNAVPHDFPPVQIGAAADAGGGFPWWLAAAGAVMLLGLALARRRSSSSAGRRSAPAAAPGPNG